MNVEQKLQMIQAMRENQTENAYRLHCSENIEEEERYSNSFLSGIGFQFFLSVLLLGIVVYLKYSNQSFWGVGLEQLNDSIRHNWNIPLFLSEISYSFL